MTPVELVRMRPGGFVVGNLPGGFTDSVTGIHVPGPKVRTDPQTRHVVEVTHLPDPVQLPHRKIVSAFERLSGQSEPQRTEREVGFDEIDDFGTAEGLFLALQTGVIGNVADAKVQELYPKAWAARQECIVFRNGAALAEPMADLIEQFQARIVEERATQAKIAADGAINPPPAPRNRQG